MRWIIGDIHGMLRPLETLIDAISKADSAPQLIFTGDYVNRGPDSRGVIEFLLKLTNARFVRGNHDDIFDLLINDDCYVCHPSAPDQLLAYRWFFEQGLDNTLTSYGADYAMLEKIARRPSREKLRTILAPVPPSHREFIRKLVPVVEEPDLFVAHGKWDVDLETNSPSITERLERQPSSRYGLLWGRFSEAELRSPKAWTRTGYFGHTPVVNYSSMLSHGNVPLRADRVALLDTGAALGPIGRLTAFCPETDSFLQASRDGKRIDGTSS